MRGREGSGTLTSSRNGGESRAVADPPGIHDSTEEVVNPPVLSSRWYTKSPHGRGVYAQTDVAPGPHDLFVCLCDSPTVATRLVELWNTELERRGDG